MAFKVTTAERQNAVTVKTLDVPAEFIAAMEAEYATTVSDPTRELVIGGDTAKETALYVVWAKHWGMNRETGKLSVFKQPTKKGDDGLSARLAVRPYDPNAAKRGRKATTK